MSSKSPEGRGRADGEGRTERGGRAVVFEVPRLGEEMRVKSEVRREMADHFIANRRNQSARVTHAACPLLSPSKDGTRRGDKEL